MKTVWRLSELGKIGEILNNSRTALTQEFLKEHPDWQTGEFLTTKKAIKAILEDKQHPKYKDFQETKKKWFDGTKLFAGFSNNFYDHGYEHGYNEAWMVEAVQYLDYYINKGEYKKPNKIEVDGIKYADSSFKEASETYPTAKTLVNLWSDYVGGAFYSILDRNNKIPIHTAPGNRDTKRLIYTNITEAFITQLKLSFYIGTYLILPNIMYSLWAFIKPGLYDNEKRFIKNTFIPSIILFILSIILSYNFLIPAIYKFFIGFETNFENSMISIELEAKISEYVSTILQTVVVMSLLSQYPIIILILMYLNIIDHKWLIGRRKLFIMSFFCLGALVTPPDVLSQIFLAIILLVSYEFMLYAIILYRKYTN